MPIAYAKTLTEEDRRLAEAAEAASRDAVARAFAAGLSILVEKEGRLVRISPDGTETAVDGYAIPHDRRTKWFGQIDLEGVVVA